ncbi:hypothetical protein NPIL_372601 [Nephila pilipes]|uniref:Uncharacterized protein n=1 Tax=Nephila pilipes TaxID=299642 RepID=A0A8X6QH93_NEPPI|nr:hypothetical protein NPIL_372601 [Nephila pilipes]
MSSTVFTPDDGGHDKRRSDCRTVPKMSESLHTPVDPMNNSKSSTGISQMAFRMTHHAQSTAPQNEHPCHCEQPY